MATRTLDLETRFDVGEAGVFGGYASVYGVRDTYGDIWQPGVFADTLTEHRTARTRPAMYWQHDPTEIIGVWESIAEDERGLKVSGRLVLETRRGQEAYALLKAGALDGLSVGFRTRKAARAEGGGRILHAVSLVEISLVSRAAVPGARVSGIRSANGPAGLAAFIRGAAATIRGKQP